MIKQKEIEESLETLSRINTVDKYFRDEDFVCLTKAFCTKFGPFEQEQRRSVMLSARREHIDFLAPGCIGTYYYFSTIKEILFKTEDEVKEKLLSEFATLLNNLTEKIESNKKVEIEQLFIEKDKQIRDLEKKIETIQKSNEPSSTFKLLNSDELAIEDYFSADKNSQNFEFIENNSFPELPSKDFVS